jgi:hypothetical protein
MEEVSDWTQEGSGKMRCKSPELIYREIFLNNTAKRQKEEEMSKGKKKNSGLFRRFYNVIRTEWSSLSLQLSW